MIALTIAVALLSQVPQIECVTAYGDTRCPRTPWGKCVAYAGKIFCGDPAPQAFTPYQDPPQVECVCQRDIEPVSCLAAYGTAACGYDCKAAYGNVACASSPWGRCVAANGKITCSD
jgi:hypothetical protein